MLIFLSIKNFAIIQSSEIYFEKGMTTITGETGAGKSILIDALSFVLGSRLDKNLSSCINAEVCATFDLSKLIGAKQWLEQNHYIIDDNELLLRRIIIKGGKSKLFINGTVATVSQVKEISDFLISFYGQHAHHNLLKQAAQLERLDQFSGNMLVIKQVADSSLQVQNLTDEYSTLCDRQKKIETEQALLSYQYDELSNLELQESELEDLEQEHNRLSNADSHLIICDFGSQLLYEADDNINSKLDNFVSELASLAETDTNCQNSLELIDQAKIYLQEAYQGLIQSKESITQDPQRLNIIDQRISIYFDVARKHHVSPHDLYQYYIDIGTKLELLGDVSQQKIDLQKLLDNAHNKYHTIAQKLSRLRLKSAELFSNEIEKKVKLLNIPKGKFRIAITSDKQKISKNGYDTCDFEICFNPGQPYSKISQIASGGELSRIGLAIQAITSERVAPPILIFDEVDVGVSGATAEIVGSLLKCLSKNSQILCITHQSQVAVQGNQQLHISKSQTSSGTYSKIIKLSNSQRIDEIARITGGVEISEKTLQHAKEIFTQHHSLK